jgi:hypothetical protein
VAEERGLRRHDPRGLGGASDHTVVPAPSTTAVTIRGRATTPCPRERGVRTRELERGGLERAERRRRSRRRARQPERLPTARETVHADLLCEHDRGDVAAVGNRAAQRDRPEELAVVVRRRPDLAFDSDLDRRIVDARSARQIGVAVEARSAR